MKNKLKNFRSIYFVEIRRRIKGGRENVCLRQNFGGFSSVKRTQKYIQKEGRQIARDFARGHKQKDLFFAILRMDVDRLGWEWPVAEVCLDLNGKETYWFTSQK